MSVIITVFQLLMKDSFLKRSEVHLNYLLHFFKSILLWIYNEINNQNLLEKRVHKGNRKTSLVFPSIIIHIVHINNNNRVFLKLEAVFTGLSFIINEHVFRT